MTIDVQNVFFTRATKRNAKNVEGRMANIEKVWKLAAARNIPVFITFEDSKSGDHALPPTLTAARPPSAQDFIKTTFAATGQPQFVPALMCCNVKRFLVLGAETDVCVLQTILGMRRAGLEVLVVTECLFTEEVNTVPAFRRYKQAGVVEINMSDAEALLQSGGASSTPAPSTNAPPTIVQPLALGVLLNGVEGNGLSAADPNGSPKMVRVRELLLVSEWFKLPLFAVDPQATSNGMPADWKSIITRPITPLASRPASIKQLAVAGGHAGVSAVVTGAKTAGADVFLVEDALVGGGSSDLKPLYQGGAVPATYKTLYYELIQSVDKGQWPSQQWVTDGNRFFDLTKAPEELPPLTITQSR